MDQDLLLTRQFEENRDHLRAVAYRMLGSLSEAEDAIQQTWLRLNRTDTSDVANLGGWLTTVISRICLDMLRSRKSRREDPLGELVHVPDPIVTRADGTGNPEHEALQTDAVGLALLVVLDTLAPSERLAFALHDMFAVPFEDIAPILDRSPTTARQLASRARRKVQQADPTPEADFARQAEVVDAFQAASRSGDFDALLAVLDPDVVLRADGGDVSAGLSKVVHGAADVAGQAITFQRFSHIVQPILVNGAPGHLAAPHGKPFSLTSFKVRNGKIVEMNILADPARLAQLDLPVLDG